MGPLRVRASYNSAGFRESDVMPGIYSKTVETKQSGGVKIQTVYIALITCKDYDPGQYLIAGGNNVNKYPDGPLNSANTTAAFATKMTEASWDLLKDTSQKYPSTEFYNDLMRLLYCPPNNAPPTLEGRIDSIKKYYNVYVASFARPIGGFAMGGEGTNGFDNPNQGPQANNPFIKEFMIWSNDKDARGDRLNKSTLDTLKNNLIKSSKTDRITHWDAMLTTNSSTCLFNGYVSEGQIIGAENGGHCCPKIESDTYETHTDTGSGGGGGSGSGGGGGKTDDNTGNPGPGTKEGKGNGCRDIENQCEDDIYEFQFGDLNIKICNGKLVVYDCEKGENIVYKDIDVPGPPGPCEKVNDKPCEDKLKNIPTGNYTIKITGKPESLQYNGFDLTHPCDPAWKQSSIEIVKGTAARENGVKVFHSEDGKLLSVTNPKRLFLRIVVEKPNGEVTYDETNNLANNMLAMIDHVDRHVSVYLHGRLIYNNVIKKVKSR